ncbi:hypothetical protein [Virgibacillus sp. DJP39]|uniref:hypothetical protein n=1 Tax=Virgibacillus sp. DJP39 TaxID=3409790 RepID=UPI003BB6A4D4
MFKIKILIGQPRREDEIKQLENEIKNNSEVDLILFPEGYFKQNKLEEVCRLAEKYHTYIVAGYKDENNKDKAYIANRTGKLILERAKTPEEVNLCNPSKTEDNGLRLGYLLCREIFQGIEDLDRQDVDLILNPIGVGMYSEEQFDKWTGEARKIAIDQKSIVIGTSHADGSYRNCGFSIPIAYCFDKNGNDVLISKNDVRTRIVDTETKLSEIIEYTTSK